MIAADKNTARYIKVAESVAFQPNLSGNEIPFYHITAPPVSPLIGGKQKIVALISDNYRIGCCAVLSPFAEIGNRSVSVVNVYGIAIGFLLCFSI